VTIPRFGQISAKSEKELQNDLKKFMSVGIDESQTPAHLEHENFIDLKNRYPEQKTVKNATEIANMMDAAKKDSAAIINFLHWLHNRDNRDRHHPSSESDSCAADSLTELEIAEKMLSFRRRQNGFIGESFPCIAAADEHSSIVHYSPTDESDASLKNILLLDSGGQYKYGTTDITRTVCINFPTHEQKLFYTLVLKGHIAIASAQIPVGSTGAQLDPLARQFLWKYSSDYDHGTGHGIGYVSHVHEGPAGISKNNNVQLKAGMILSNEPGYYRANHFGIRLENMMLIHETCGFLWFETISLVPFEMKFIDKKLLTVEEAAWIGNYHKNIVLNMKDLLNDDVLAWLEKYALDWTPSP
jgi:Xaa-Pro aminopeptidase